MTLTPHQRNEIRAHHERALTLLNYGQLPTNREFIQIVHDLGHMLTDHTNRNRP